MQRPTKRLRRVFASPRRQTIRPRLEQLECRLAPAVSLLNHIDGMNVGDGGGAVPPDTCGAAGPGSFGDYIETVNSAITIYNKSSNAVIASDSLSDFLFTKGGLSSSWGLNDATISYDEPTGQFIVGDLGLTSDGGSALNIAVSKNSTPTTLDSSDWNFYTIDMTEANESGDYPGNMGFNADAFCFTFNMFPTNGNGNYHVEVAALSQSSLASGASVFVNRFDESGFSWRPVTMHNSSAGGPMWFVTEHGDNTTIDLERVDNILSSHNLTTFHMGVDSYDPINDPLNPDGSVITTNIDTRIMKAAENANGELVAAQAVGYDVGSSHNEDVARWYEFNVSNENSPSLMQQGAVGFGANTYTVYPSIDINNNGRIGMGFSKSGTDYSTDYMSAYITGQDAADGEGVNENPVLIKAGDSDNLDGREGDFSGINLDPNDGTTFWVADEYTTGGSWGTEIAQFQMNLQNFYVVNGQLQIFGDQLGSNYNDLAVISVDGRGGVYADLNGEQVAFDAGQISSILIELGGGSNVTLLYGTPLGVTTNIDGGGSDTVYVGNGTTQTILGNVYIEDPPAFTNVIVEDSADSTAETVQMGTWTPGGDTNWGYIAGLFGNGNLNYEYADTNSLTYNTGTGSDTINVQGTGVSTTIVTGADATINIGNGGSVAGIQGTLYIEGPGTFNNINIDDSADTTAQTVQMGTWTPLGDTNWGYIAGLGGAANINYEYDDTNNVTLQTGTAAGNVINVFGTGALGITYIVTGATANVNVGNGGSVAALQGILYVDGPGSRNTININDSADSTLQTVQMGTWTPFGDTNWGYIAGLGGAANINYEYADTNSVTLQTGTAAGNVINVLGTGVTTNIQANAATTINVGNGTVAAVLGTLNLENTPDYNTIVLNDGSDTHARTVTVRNIGANPSDSQGNGDPWGQVSGLAPAVINYEYLDTASVTIDGSSAASTYNIQGTGIQTAATTVNGGAGSDTFNLGVGNNLSGLQGALTLNGGGGTNTVNANDSSSASGQSYTLSSTQLAGTDFATITYASLHALKVTGSGNDTLTLLTPVPIVATTFNGGSGSNTLVGPTVSNLTTWTISGANKGKVDSVSFSNCQNLVGDGNDLFKFTTSTASLSGTLNGGGGINNNTLSYATLGSSYLVDVTLTSNNSGSATHIGGGFSNINYVTGSSDIGNTLQGPNSANEWIITGTNAGDLNTGATTDFGFTHMGNLVGGTGVDTFRMHSTSSKLHSLNGGGAPVGQGDWLKYSEFPSSSTVTVNLATGSATNINGGAAGSVTNIQNVLGTATGTNVLTGDAQGNILIGGSGANTLVGGSGNSLLIGGSGHGSITGGSGEDILIAGFTTDDPLGSAGVDALMAILAELQSSDTFAQKVSDITNGNASGGGSDLNGGNQLTWGGTVRASTGTFALSGDTSSSAAADWFFANASSTVSDFNDDGVQDEHNNNAIGVF